MRYRTDARKAVAAAACAALLVVAGCAVPPQGGPGCPCVPAKPPPSAARYEPLEVRDLPDWRLSPAAASLRAFIAGCAHLAAESVLQPACAAARALPAGDDEAARRFFEDAFAAYAVVAPDGTRDGLVTGYYEPVLAGSRTRSEGYSQPIYGVPDDLVVVDLAGQYPELRGMRLRGRLNGRRLEPYYSRGQIDAGDNGFHAPVIAWVADPVELFFLQIQGSGQVQLDTGERIRVGYADQNGHPYRSLGRHLVESGELSLDQASMQGIKAWAAANPERLRAALDYNASYVFFRELPAAQGPIGAQGVPLEPGYSVAIDPTYVPLGAPLYVATTYPLSPDPLERVVMAQDTGGAIRGAVRADLYWGSGPEAGTVAGRMRQPARVWILWPRGATLPRPLP